MQKIRYAPNEKWDLQYGLHYSETSPYGRYDRHNRFKNGTLRYAEWDYGPQKWLMNHINILHKKDYTLFDQVAFRLAQQFFEESRLERLFGNNERNTQIEKVIAYSANIDFLRQVHEKHTLYYGLEYVFNDVSSKGILTDIRTESMQKGPSRYPVSEWRSMAIYVNDKLQWSDRLTLQAGLRYNLFMLDADFSNNLDFYPFPFSEAKIQNSAFTGSLGGIYRPSEQWVVKTNFGTAFRSPNVDDIGKVFDSEPGTVTVPDPNLKAEYAWNVDLGVARVIQDIVKLDITGYYTLLQNALVRRNFQLNGQDSIFYNGEMSRVQAIQNAAFARVYGIQAGVEVILPVGFSFVSDVNIQLGEEELDDGSLSPSRHAAPWFGTSRLRYRKNRFIIECNTVYQGSRSNDELPVEEQTKDEIYAKDGNGNNYSPSWYTLNVKCIYQLGKNISISGGLENLTDQRYRPYSSGLSGAGRNVILSLSARF
jgi:hemoglobin/transferrin/lactoferrin receptor protein